MTLLLYIVTLICFSWFAYYIGHRLGYKVGREDELNKAAQRYERLRRFYSLADYDK